MVENLLEINWHSYHKNTKKNIIVLLWPAYYMPQNPQHTIIKTSLKYYNQIQSFGT